MARNRLNRQVAKISQNWLKIGKTYRLTLAKKGGFRFTAKLQRIYMKVLLCHMNPQCLTLHPSKHSEIINYAILGANITSKYFGGIFVCNGPVAFLNGILSRIIGQPRDWVIGSESSQRSIAWKVSDRVGVDGVVVKFPFFFFRVFAVSPKPKTEGQSTAAAWKCAETLKSLETNKKETKMQKTKKN